MHDISYYSKAVDGVIIDDGHEHQVVYGVMIDDQQVTGRKHSTLIDAFRACTSSDENVITDVSRAAAVAVQLLSDVPATGRTQLFSLPEINGSMNFHEFVGWAEENSIRLPLGLPATPHAVPVGFRTCLPFPADWKGPRHTCCNQRKMVEDAEVLSELQTLLDVSYKKIWTRDRKTTGINRVPDGYKLDYALRNQNYESWYSYYTKRHELNHASNQTSFQKVPVLTGDAEHLVKRHDMQDRCNEWLMFHGTDAGAAESICSSGFAMDLAGSNTGSLYGKGMYCAESITKADEYARSDADDVCCTLVCRFAGGLVLSNSEDTPDSAKLQKDMRAQGCHTILGDRTKVKNTYREFVLFDTDQMYVEYILFYRRIYPAGIAPSPPRAVIAAGAPVSSSAIGPSTATPCSAATTPATKALAVSAGVSTDLALATLDRRDALLTAAHSGVTRSSPSEALVVSGLGKPDATHPSERSAESLALDCTPRKESELSSDAPDPLGTSAELSALGCMLGDEAEDVLGAPDPLETGAETSDLYHRINKGAVPAPAHSEIETETESIWEPELVADACVASPEHAMTRTSDMASVPELATESVTDVVTDSSPDAMTEPATDVIQKDSTRTSKSGVIAAPGLEGAASWFAATAAEKVPSCPQTETFEFTSYRAAAPISRMVASGHSHRFAEVPVMHLPAACVSAF